MSKRTNFYNFKRRCIQSGIQIIPVGKLKDLTLKDEPQGKYLIAVGTSLYTKEGFIKLVQGILGRTAREVAKAMTSAARIIPEVLSSWNNTQTKGD